ncbi:hypothetical protein VP1G_01030 [Cytospora mali]|uniref:BTB domain-containing protein n=1 Tax=Cytospora mali TaxID=578113 RepID=A0A194UPC6_CYTMA|nr:hypothetical protein VP1G_01030 [Valsa mali var. pyri (nom. inval.)]
MRIKNGIRGAAGVPSRLISQDDSENDAGSEGTEEDGDAEMVGQSSTDKSQQSMNAVGADDAAVTVYGPRRKENVGDKEYGAIKATVAVSDAQRLIMETVINMSSPPIQASAALERVAAEAMPLPESRPDSPANVHTNTPSYNKSDDTVKPNKLCDLTTEQVQMIVSACENDNAKALESATNEDAIASCIVNTSPTDVASPKIAISAIDSNDGKSPSPAANSTNADLVSHIEHDKDKFIDPNDRTNDGDVVKFFFTSSTRKRLHSPVSSEPGCCNPHLHRDSDLYIKACDKNGQVYVFEVVSTILEKASPKFENMVYGTHVRGNKEEWLWELPDSPLGLKIMFCLLHNKFPRAMLVTNPKPSQLYTVLRVLDKYEIDLHTTNSHLLAKSWTHAFRKRLPKSKLTHLQALYVAYKIGDFKSLKETIREVSHDVSISQDGSLRVEDGRHVRDIVPIEKELLKAISDIRSKDIETVLKSLKDPYEYLMDTEKSDGQNYCKSIDGQLECNQKLLGSLLSNLLQQKLFPVPEAKEYLDSFNSLAEKVSNMEIRGLYYPGVEMHKQRHTLCRLGQDTVVKTLREGMEYVPLSDKLIKYMYFMCKRCAMLRDEGKEFEPYGETIRDPDIMYNDEFQKHIWGWIDPDESDIENDTDGSCDEDSGLFDVIENSVCTEQKVSN